MSLNDADSKADSEILKRARRLGIYLLLMSTSWVVIIILNMVVTTPRIVQGERVVNRNLLRLGPQVLQLFTPCHLPLFGEYPEPLYLAVCYGFSFSQIFIAILIARRAFELRNLKNHRGCKRAAILAAVPLIGLWIGTPCWILSAYLLAFLWKPEVKKAFEKSAATLQRSFIMKSIICVSLILFTTISFAQDNAAERTAADGPFVPKPALPGGIVLSLYPPNSPMLNQQRVHEAEKYNTTGKFDRLMNTLTIHNPSIEVHLADDRASNGAAVIVAPGGGHKILWVGPEGYDLVPFFAKYGVSTIVLRNRLRVDGYGRGGHGGSISPRDGIPFGTWQDRYLDWFKDLGFLDKPGTETKAAKDVAAWN